MRRDIIKKKSDDRDYAYEILDSGLGVLMISEPGVKRSSASIAVNVGNYSDPEGYEGLAHFLEHMLFQGSKKYPNTNTYNEHINNNGGTTNAHTGSEQTMYYFDVVSSGFEVALDIFSRFFIDPLFKEENLRKEMNAVDSEHSKNINDDAWKIRRLVNTMVNTQHPLKDYGCGTLETLNKDDIRKVMIDFHGKHYKPQYMKLVILSGMTINSISKLVKKLFVFPDPHFPLIPGFPQALFISKPHGPRVFEYSNLKPFNYEDTPMGLMTPTAKFNVLSILWQLPNVSIQYKKKSVEHIIFLLGSKKKGCLVDTLINSGLVDDVSANIHEVESTGILLGLDIAITDYGVSQLSAIVNLLYEYVDVILKMSKESHKVHYNNQKKMSMIDFEYGTKKSAIDYSQIICSDLHMVNYKDAIVHPYLYGKFEDSYGTIIECIKKIKLSNSVMIFSSYLNEEILKNTSYPVIKEGIDAYYGFNYKVMKYSDYVSIKMPNVRTPLVTLNPPSENKLLKSIKTDIICKWDKNAKPVLVENNPDKFNSVWHKCGEPTNLPRTVTSIVMYNSKIYESPDNFVAFSMYCSAVIKLIGPELEDYAFCSSDIRLSPEDGKVLVYMDCMSGLEIELFSFFVRSLLISSMEPISEKLFETIKGETIRNYESMLLKPPHVLCDYYIKENSCEGCFKMEELIESAKKVQIKDLFMISGMLVGECQYFILSQGNISRNDAILMNEIMKFSMADCKESMKVYPDRIKTLNDGEVKIVYNDTHPNLSEENSATKIIFEIGNIDRRKGLVDICLLMISGNFIGEKFFNEIRTNRQLGYIVRSSIDKLGDYVLPLYGYSLLVQSKTTNPDEIESIMIDFIDGLSMNNPEEFELAKQSIIERMQEESQTLVSDFLLNMDAIIGEHYLFDIKNIMANCVADIEFDEAVRFYDKYFRGSGRKLRISKVWSPKK